MDSQTNNPATEKILEAINTGQIKKRPRWHFVLQAILTLSAVGMVLIVLLFLASFLFFVLLRTGVLLPPSDLGHIGLLLFVVALPQHLALLFLLLIIFIIALQILVRRYSFSYRRPLFYSLLSIVLVTLIGGYAIARTPLHRFLIQDAARGPLPVIGEFYHEFKGLEFLNIQAGTITEITENGFKLASMDEGTLTVIVTGDTRLWDDLGYAVGNKVVVVGERNNGTIKASMIHLAGK
ncbi:MAG: hypothetical protein HY865_26080 [Chloroflexi bacterium]|nr:hypothetical protein [Chloroflexota bacterium]